VNLVEERADILVLDNFKAGLVATRTATAIMYCTYVLVSGQHVLLLCTGFQYYRGNTYCAHVLGSSERTDLKQYITYLQL
jgi:hypothetical protein